jgi:all-trans-retinol 13,14-reductase
MKYDYIVIGSGISGLVSAIILSRRGSRVAVLEKTRESAPLLKGFQRKGIHFDTGFHYTGAFGQGEVLDSYFRYLGIADKLQKIPYDPECFDTFHFPEHDFTFRFPSGYKLIRQRLLEAFPKEKPGIDQYLKAVEQEFNTSPHLNLDLSSFDLVPFSKFSEMSLMTFLKGLTNDPRLRSVLSMHHLLYGTEPSLSSVSIHAQVCGSLYQSVYGIKGGGRALALALIGRLKDLGSDIFSGMGVTRIITSSDSFQGVMLENGETLKASGCISSIHPGTLMTMVDDKAFRPPVRRRFRAFEDTSSTFMFSASIDKLPSCLDRKNFFLCPDMDMDDYCRTDRPLEKRPFFLAACQNVGPSAKSGLIMLCPASISEVQPWEDSKPNRRPAEYQDMKQSLMLRARNHILARIPEMSGSLSILDCATPLTFRDYSNAPSGCLYGIKQKAGQISPSPLSKIRGLYLTGQSLAGPGILGGTVSAFLTCGFILGRDVLYREVKLCR